MNSTPAAGLTKLSKMRILSGNLVSAHRLQWISQKTSQIEFLLSPMACHVAVNRSWRQMVSPMSVRRADANDGGRGCSAHCQQLQWNLDGKASKAQKLCSDFVQLYPKILNLAKTRSPEGPVVNNVPVSTAEAIEKWLWMHNSSPMTGAVLAHRSGGPERTVRHDAPATPRRWLLNHQHNPNSKQLHKQVLLKCWTAFSQSWW